MRQDITGLEGMLWCRGTRALVGALFLGFGIVACGGPGAVEESGSQSRPASGSEPVGSVESAGNVGANEAHESPQFELEWPQRVDAPCCYQRGLDLRAVVVVKEDVEAILRVLEEETPWESLRVWFSPRAIADGHFWLDDLDRRAQFLGFRRSGPSPTDWIGWDEWQETQGWRNDVVYLRDEVSIRGIDEERLSWVAAMLRAAEVPHRMEFGDWSGCLVPRSRREEAEAWLASEPSLLAGLELNSGWRAVDGPLPLLIRGRTVRGLVGSHEDFAGIQEHVELIEDADVIELWVAPGLELNPGRSRDDPDFVVPLPGTRGLAFESSLDWLLPGGASSFEPYTSLGAPDALAEVPGGCDWLVGALLAIQGVPARWTDVLRRGWVDRVHVADSDAGLARHLLKGCESLPLLFVDSNSEYEKPSNPSPWTWIRRVDAPCCYQRGRDLRAIVLREEEIPQLLGVLDSQDGFESLQLWFSSDSAVEKLPWLMELEASIEASGFLASTPSIGDAGAWTHLWTSSVSVTYLREQKRLGVVDFGEWPEVAALLSMVEIPCRFQVEDQVEVWVPPSRLAEAARWLDRGGRSGDGARFSSGWIPEDLSTRRLSRGSRIRALARTVSDLVSLTKALRDQGSIETLEVWLSNSLAEDWEADRALLDGFEIELGRLGLETATGHSGVPAGQDDAYPVRYFARSYYELINYSSYQWNWYYFGILELHGIPHGWESGQSNYAYGAASDWPFARMRLEGVPQPR